MPLPEKKNIIFPTIEFPKRIRWSLVGKIMFPFLRYLVVSMGITAASFLAYDVYMRTFYGPEDTNKITKEESVKINIFGPIKASINNLESKNPVRSCYARMNLLFFFNVMKAKEKDFDSHIITGALESRPELGDICKNLISPEDRNMPIVEIETQPSIVKYLAVIGKFKNEHTESREMAAHRYCRNTNIILERTGHPESERTRIWKKKWEENLIVSIGGEIGEGDVSDYLAIAKGLGLQQMAESISSDGWSEIRCQKKSEI